MPVRADASVHFSSPRITVTLGNVDYTVPPAPAATWLAILTAEQVDVTRIVPGMFSETGQELLDEHLLDGQVTLQDVKQAAQDVITIASGHPWWWTLGLLSITRGEHGTQVLGEMARLDATTTPLGAWCNALYALLVKWMKEQDRTRFDAQLDTPPADVETEVEDLIDEEASSRAFFAMMNQGNG